MNKLLISGFLAVSALTAGATDLFFYSPEKGDGGLKIAVREEGGQWRSIGNGFDFVRSDFGPWGSGKKMWNPQLFPTSAGWSLLFRATPDVSVIGWAESPDLIT